MARLQKISLHWWEQLKCRPFRFVVFFVVFRWGGGNGCNIHPRKIHVEPPKNGGLEDVMFLLHWEIETVSGVYDDASSWNG